VQAVFQGTKKYKILGKFGWSAAQTAQFQVIGIISGASRYSKDVHVVYDPQKRAQF